MTACKATITEESIPPLKKRQAVHRLSIFLPPHLLIKEPVLFAPAHKLEHFYTHRWVKVRTTFFFNIISFEY
jgi:hypothetical protein